MRLLRSAGSVPLLEATRLNESDKVGMAIDYRIEKLAIDYAACVAWRGDGVVWYGA